MNNETEWPDENRIDIIGTNGGCGTHYAELDKQKIVKEFAEKLVNSQIDSGISLTNEELIECADGKPVEKHSKYHREIKPGVWVDVYDVIVAWAVSNPAIQHLIKKALQPGERGHKTIEQDMQDIVDSALRAQQIEVERVK